MTYVAAGFLTALGVFAAIILVVFVLMLLAIFIVTANDIRKK